MSERTGSKKTRHLYSYAAAAEILGCSTDTVRRWVASGRLAVVRLPARLVRIDGEEIDRLITAGKDRTAERPNGGEKR